MSSTINSIKLDGLKQVINSKVFGVPAECTTSELVPDIGSLEQIKIFYFASIRTKYRTRSYYLKAFMPFIQELKKGFTPWITLYARTHSEKIEWFLEPQKSFMEGLCRIFPSPIFYVEGNIKVMLRRNSMPYYCTPIGKRLHLKELLHSAQASTIDSQLRLLDNSIGNHVLGSLDNTCLKIRFNIQLEWSEKEIRIEFPNMDTYGPHSLFRNLFAKDSTKDFTFVAEDGTEVKCHSKIITADRSAALATLVSPTTGLQESKTRRAEMKYISKEALTQLVRYLYGFTFHHNEFNCQVALELLQVAHRYELTLLERELKLMFQFWNDKFFTPNVIMETYYFSRNVPNLNPVRERMLCMMSRMSPMVLRTCEPYKELNDDEKENLGWMLFELAQ